MRKLESCPICKGISFDKFIECKDYNVSKEVFSIEKCSSCGLTLTNPRPKKENLKKNTYFYA